MKATTSFPSSSPASSSSSSTDWAGLPWNLIYMVLNKLLLLSDMIKFSRVCANWRSVAKERFQELNLTPHMYFNQNLPLLLVPSTGNNDSLRSLYSINQSQIYDLHLQVPYKKRCCGSSHGWLITLDCDSFQVIVINPFYFGCRKGIIYLPQFSAANEIRKEAGKSFNFEYVICKAVLSSDPISSPNAYALMVIYGEKRMLAFWQSGAENWTYITWSLPAFFDVIFVQGLFLAVNSLGQVYSCEINDEAYPPYNLRPMSVPLFGLLESCCRRYIVELPDKTAIVQALRMLKSCTTMLNSNDLALTTTGFFVYKMELGDDGRCDWQLLKSLEDGALFLGDNYSQYVSASRFPGCSSSSIYFTDDYHDTDAMHLDPYQFAGPSDIGVFLLDEGRLERFYVPLREQYHLPPPIWILPTV